MNASWEGDIKGSEENESEEKLIEEEDCYFLEKANLGEFANEKENEWKEENTKENEEHNVEVIIEESVHLHLVEDADTFWGWLWATHRLKPESVERVELG